MLSRHTPSVLALLLAVLTLTACGAPTASAPTPRPTTAVRLQLAWVHEYSSASFYAAEKNGRFRAQGLEAQLLEGGFKDNRVIDGLDQVLAGEADFGVTSASRLLQMRAAGKPVVAIAALFQRSPLAVLSVEAAGIQRPQDLVGKRVAVAEDGAKIAYLALLAAQGLDPASITTVPREGFGIEPLTGGKVDALVAWRINEGVMLSETGQTPSIMMFSDYGVETYDLVLFTTEQEITQRPDVVQRVVVAVMQGTQDVLDNPEQAVQYALTYNSKLDSAGQLRRLQASLPLINPAGSSPGQMQAEVWEATQKLLIDYKILQQPVDLKTAYTTRFLDAIPGR
ncbi:MAG TPA: ABC transporter substrate-binding protein [Roseiflexaceae bacterium]|nr:ABC transporter substrate-binding protein [Roseiflexaceae bacterium]